MIRNKLLFVLCIITACLVACKKEDVAIDNLSGNDIKIIGHGGMGVEYSAPLNSLKSIQESAELGIDGVEVDVQLTKDGTLVLFHDKELSEKTNRNGMLYEKNWSAIDGVAYSTIGPSTHKVISLKELLSCVRFSKNFTLTIDVKTYNQNADSLDIVQYIDALESIINEYDLHENILVEFNEIQHAQAFSQRLPFVKLFVYNEFSYALEQAIRLAAFGITVSVEDLNASLVDLAHQNNIRVATFGTDSKRLNMSAIEMSPDYIQSDELKHLKRKLR